MNYRTMTINDETFRGTRDKLIGLLEAKGYQAIREEESPHPWWQAAEHLKRTK